MMHTYLSTAHDPQILPTSITDMDRYSKEIVRSGASLSWRDLSLTSTKSLRPKKILRKSKGISFSSEILAIMGSSGSGKTSLVTLLADQFLNQDNLEFTGNVYLNDVHLSREIFSEYVKFVNQHDVLMPTLTARETMTFSAQLQCIGTDDEISIYVDKIIDELHIQNFADKLIGDNMIRGLSGGEKKLVSIANELISQPSVLILDEPTSGLDSLNALKVMKVLKQQASLGKNIILTIHQPSLMIFDLFDRLLLISSGRIVYQGKSMDSYRYFANLNFICPNNVNPSDYFDRICYIKDYFSLSIEEEERIRLLISSYRDIQETFIEETIVSQIEEGKGLDRRILKPGFKRKIGVLLRRSFLNSRRHPLVFTLRVVQAVFIGCLNALIFNNIGYDQKSIQNRNGVLFYNLDCLLLLSMQVQLLALSSERTLYIKEIKQNYFGIIQYFFAKLIAELPVQLLFAFLLSIIQYFAIPLNTENPANFVVFLIIALLTHMCGAGLGYLAGGLAGSSEEALVIGGALGIPLMMFAGYFGNVNSLSQAFGWLKYISPFYYGFQAIALNEYTGLKLDDGIGSPLLQLDIKGTVGSNIGALFTLYFFYILVTLLVLKFKEVFNFKRRALG